MIVGGIGVYSAGVYLGEIPDYGGVVDKVINIIPGQKATPEFMDMMNNYEAFIDEYIESEKNRQENITVKITKSKKISETLPEEINTNEIKDNTPTPKKRVRRQIKSN